MDSLIDASLVEARKAHASAATARKGQTPIHRPTRKQLAFDFAKDAKNRGAPHLRFLRHAYPPCTRPLDRLELMRLSELRLETHHRNRAVVVKAWGWPRAGEAVLDAVEDQHGDVDTLAVYHCDALAQPERVLQRGAVLAIKQPFYEDSKDHGPVLRIDHPSDLVPLSPSSLLAEPFLSSAGGQEKDALALKDDGNAAFGRKDYLAAVDAYTEAMRRCSNDHPDLEKTILRNRSIVNLHLQRYEQAADDARRSAVDGTPTDDKSRKSNTTAHYRAGCALYQLEQFQEAACEFGKALWLTSDDRDCHRELKRTQARLHEQATGTYDFDAMSKSAGRKQSRLDHASFLANVEVRQSSVHGNGLFATHDIPAGGLIMCEKSFATVYDTDPGVETHQIYDLNTDYTATGPHPMLLSKIVHKTLHSPALAQKLLAAYDAGYRPKCKARVVDGRTAIDVFQTAVIVEHNSFACPAVRSSDLARKGSLAGEPMGIGMWNTAAFINSACDGNARRSYIGDMAILRATKPIPRAAEILMPYVAADVDNHVTQAQYRRVWKYTCACPICHAEAQGPADERHERRRAIHAAKDLIRTSARAAPDRATTARAERLLTRIERTYTHPACATTARLGPVDLGIWLGRAYRVSGAWAAMAHVAARTLRNLGYGVDADVVGGAEGRAVAREHCHACGEAIEAAMQVACAAGRLGRAAVAARFERLARLEYVTLHGELRGFVERYGSVTAGK